MPDRYGERPDPQLGDTDDQPAEPLPRYGPTDTELRLAAVAECQLCDPDGYRGAIVCDHQDHTETNQRGIAAVRAALAARAPRPQNHPEKPPTGQPDTKNTHL